MSLRLIAAALSIVYALLIAAISLGASVTITTNALRRFGELHATALADVTLLRLESFFELPSKHVDTMVNASRYRGGVPGYDALFQKRWLDHSLFQTFAMPQTRGPNELFNDGTRVYVSTFGFDNLSDRFADGLQLQVETYSTPGNFSSNWNVNRQFYDDRLTLLNVSDPRYASQLYKVDANLALAALSQITFGGRVSLWIGQQPLVVVINNVVKSYNALVAPLRDASRNVIGYCGSIIIVDLINTYLQQIQETPSSYGFVVDSLGYILATSCPVPFQNTTVVPSGYKGGGLGCAMSGADFLVDLNTPSASEYMICRALAATYGYAPLRAVMADADLGAATSQTTAYMTVEGAGYFVASSPVAVRYPNLVMQLVITMPEMEVVGDLAGPRNVAIGVSIGATVLMSVVIAGLVSVLLRPVSTTAERLSEDDPIARTDSTTEELSMFAEVREVQLAHRAMRGELRRISAFVPLLQVTDDSLPSTDDAFVSLPASDLSTPGALSSIALDFNFVTRGEDAEGDMPVTKSARFEDRKAVRKVRRKVRFVDEDGAALVRVNVVEVPLLAVCDVAVLSANVNGFSRWCASLPGALCRDVAGSLCVGVQAAMNDALHAVRAHGGVVERFNGDQVEATFSKGHMLPSFTHAVLAGIDLIEGCPAAPRSDLMDGAARLRWRVGVAFGSSVMGHAGSEAAQASHVIGSAWTHAVACQELSKVYRTRGVIVNDRVFALMQSSRSLSLEWRVLGAEQLPGQTRKSVVVAVRRAATNVDENQERAVKMRNALQCMKLQGRDDDVAATVTEKLRTHASSLGGLEAWEAEQRLSWTNVPALEQLYSSGQWKSLPRETLRALLSPSPSI